MSSLKLPLPEGAGLIISTLYKDTVIPTEPGITLYTASSNHMEICNNEGRTIRANIYGAEIDQIKAEVEQSHQITKWFAVDVIDGVVGEMRNHDV